MRYFYCSLLLLTSLLWAGNFVTGKWLIGHASPVTLTTLRWLIAVACLLPMVWWKEKTLRLPRKAILPLIFMGLTGVVLFTILQFLALEFTSATNVGLISTLNMLSIAIFSGLILKERINPLQVAAMFFSLFGVILVLTKGNLNILLSLQFNRGDVFMLTAVGIWGIYSVCSKWAMAYVSPLMATFYSGIFGVVALLPFSFSDVRVTDVTASFIGAMLYAGVISTVVCFVLWNIGVQKLGATAAGLFLNFNPIFTALLAFILLGEQMTGMQVVGSSIVIIGCYAFTYFKSKAVSSETRAGTGQLSSVKN